MLKLYHGVTAHAHPVLNEERPFEGLLIRRDADTVILRINRDQALELIAELSKAFDSYHEVNLIFEDASPLIYKREVFE